MRLSKEYTAVLIGGPRHLSTVPLGEQDPEQLPLAIVATERRVWIDPGPDDVVDDDRSEADSGVWWYHLVNDVLMPRLGSIDDHGRVRYGSFEATPVQIREGMARGNKAKDTRRWSR